MIQFCFCVWSSEIDFSTSKTFQGDEKTMERIEHFFARRWSRAIVDVPLNSTCKSNLIVQKERKIRWKKINRQNFMLVFIFENVKHCQNARPARRQELGKIQKYPTRNSLLQSTSSSWWKFNSWWMEFAIRWIYISSCYQQKKRFICHGRVDGTRMCAILKLALV